MTFILVVIRQDGDARSRPLRPRRPTSANPTESYSPSLHFRRYATQSRQNSCFFFFDDGEPAQNCNSLGEKDAGVTYSYNWKNDSKN